MCVSFYEQHVHVVCAKRCIFPWLCADSTLEWHCVYLAGSCLGVNEPTQRNTYSLSATLGWPSAPENGVCVCFQVHTISFKCQLTVCAKVSTSVLSSHTVLERKSQEWVRRWQVYHRESKRRGHLASAGIWQFSGWYQLLVKIWKACSFYAKSCLFLSRGFWVLVWSLIGVLPLRVWHSVFKVAH